jgi:hypothetical protein
MHIPVDHLSWWLQIVFAWYNEWLPSNETVVEIDRVLCYNNQSVKLYSVYLNGEFGSRNYKLHDNNHNLRITGKITYVM